jgi:hypothetical protein
VITSRGPNPGSGRPDLRVVDVNALEPCTVVSAARQLAAHIGCGRREAELMVGRYLDEVSEQIGCSVHRWGLDPHDLAAILTDNGHQVSGADALSDPLDRAGAAVAGAEHTAHLAGTGERATAMDTDTDTDTDTDFAAAAEADVDAGGAVDRWGS